MAMVGLGDYWTNSWGQDYKEKHKTWLKTNVKRTVLNNTKLRHFWAQIVSWVPTHARKMFIILAPDDSAGNSDIDSDNEV